jgi:hypothetical protein
MAVQWSLLRWPYSLAWMVRLMSRVEEEKPRGWMFEAIRHAEDRFGLTPRALLALRWTIAEPAEPATVTPIAEAPKRWLIVEDADGDG